MIDMNAKPALIVMVNGGFIDASERMIDEYLPLMIDRYGGDFLVISCDMDVRAIVRAKDLSSINQLKGGGHTNIITSIEDVYEYSLTPEYAELKEVENFFMFSSFMTLPTNMDSYAIRWWESKNLVVVTPDEDLVLARGGVKALPKALSNPNRFKIWNEFQFRFMLMSK